MPNRINVHTSSAHRIACMLSLRTATLTKANCSGLSLYRALLKQSSALHVGGSNEHSPSKSSDLLSSLVQFRFHQDRKLKSPTQIANGLKAGYEALDLLDACNKSFPSAPAQLKSLLESTAAQAEYTSAYRAALAAARSPTSPQKLSKIAHLKAIATKANSTRYPWSKPVLERPLPLDEIKGGKRRVPNLVSAQGIPFLRYSKPQPISLSRVIRQKQDWDQRKWTQQESLKGDMVIAQWEDEWDEIVAGQMAEEHGQGNGKVRSPRDSDGREGAGGREASWKHEMVVAEGELYQQIKQSDWKNAEMGRKMWEIVVKERELAAQEKREAKIQRRIERKAAAAATAAAATAV
jgi:hypothetical protein